MMESFICNVCSTACAGGVLDRETPSCANCGSNVRIRSLIRALSLELFGAALRLDEFPVLKSVRGLGLSDSESYAGLLSQKFDYVNTHYHKEPRVDIATLIPEDRGAFDFILSSEVFEHVTGPIETAFQNINRVLKPNGKLIMTVPYAPDGDTIEHFAGVREYTVTMLGGEPVLVGRGSSGELSATSSLLFHGGQGATLEMRRFSAAGLKSSLASAGFSEIVFHGDDFPEYGIRHAESWSLPLAARKETFPAAAAFIRELAGQYRARLIWGHDLERQRTELEAEIVRRTEWARSLEAELHQAGTHVENLQHELDRRTAWAQSLESDLEQRTEWARSLEREAGECTKWARSLEADLDQRTTWAIQLQKQVADLEAECSRLRAALPYRVTRRVGKLFRRLIPG